MKVLHIIESLAPRYGGPVSALRGLAPAQRALGLDVSIWTTTADYPHGELHAPGDGHLSDGTPVQFFKINYEPIKYSNSMRLALQRGVRNFDLLHVHGLYRFPPTYAARCARKRGLPYIIRPFGSLMSALHNQSAHSILLKRLYERWFDWPNLRGAGAIHCTSATERVEVAKSGLQTPSFVLPNGIDWTKYGVLPHPGSFRSRIGVGNAPLVLFLSRLDSVKGLDLLVPAFAAARQAVPSATLAIVGPDNKGYGEEVRRWVKEHHLQQYVYFVGTLTGVAVMDAYVDADVFVLPSYSENFGNVVAEAMACGRPVVISNRVGIHGEVAAAEAGMVTRCDVAEITDALITLLRDPARREAMGAAGRRLVHNNWRWNAVAAQLTTEYEKVIARSRGRAEQ